MDQPALAKDKLKTEVAQPTIAGAQDLLSQGIAAVSFDVGGTLIECWPSVGHIYAEVASEHGCPAISPDLLNARFAEAWRAIRDFRHTTAQWSALVDATFLGLIPQPPSQTFFPHLYARFSHVRAWHLFEDVFPTLDALRAVGLKLGIVSNWDDRLRGLLRQFGLADKFDATVISCEAGSVKPAPRIFLNAAELLQTTPSSVLHVGDSLTHDVHGARAAGMRAWLLDRSRTTSQPGVVRSLCELAAS